MIWHSNLVSIIKVLLDRATPTTYPSSVAASNQTACSPQSLSYVPSDPLQKHSLTPVLMNEKNKVNNFLWAEPDSKPIHFPTHLTRSFSDLWRPKCSCDSLLNLTKQQMMLVGSHVTWGGTFQDWRGPLAWKPWDLCRSSHWAVAKDGLRRWGWTEVETPGSGLFCSRRGGVLSDWTIIKMKALHPHSKSLHYFPSKQYILPDMKGHHDGEIFPHLFPIWSLKDLRQFSTKTYVYSQVVAIAR